MKSNMKRLYASFISLCVCITSVAQLDFINSGKQPDLPTWQTYELQKYGNIGVSLYTGTINYSVPVYTYKDVEFEFPISLDYATNGLRVNHKSGLLGHGWSLNCPGRITREIKGVPDEEIVGVGQPGTFIPLYGYSFIQNHNMLFDGVCDASNHTYSCLFDLGDNKFYDGEPDIYTFSFNGYSGSFRRTKPTNGHQNFLMFNVNSSSMGLRVKSLNETGYIIMVDRDGYEYKFVPGEYTKPYSGQNSFGFIENRNISYYLNEIKSTSGRKIILIYESPSNDNPNTRDINYYPTLMFYHCIYSDFESSTGDVNRNISISSNDNYYLRLKRIIFPDSTIAFLNYEEGAHEFRYSTPNGNITNAHSAYDKLSTIMVERGDDIIKLASLNYETKSPSYGAGNSFTFLKNIKISGEGEFSFDYYDMQDYPAMGTLKSDHWGYYNGASGGITEVDMFNCLYYDSSYNEYYRNTFNKSPDFNAALSGSLKRINYPTGGFSVITYEPHTYSAHVIRNSSTDFLPSLVAQNQDSLAGGIRIKRVVTHMADSTVNDTVDYEYLSSGQSGLSSGSLINCPRYGISYNTEPLYNTGKQVMYYNLTNSMFDFNSTHIEYSHVREVRSNGGYKDYFYSSYSNYPDQLYFPLGSNDKDSISHVINYWSDPNGNGSGPIIFTNPCVQVTNIMTPVPSSQSMRGLLQREDYYDSDSVLLFQKTYSYNYPLVNVDTLFKTVGDNMRLLFYPRYNIEMSSTSEIFHTRNSQQGSNNFKKTTNFTYDSFGLPVTTATATSTCDTIIERIKYSGDSLTNSGIIGLMRDNNVMSNVLFQESIKKKTAGTTLISRTKYDYCQPCDTISSLFRPSKMERWIPGQGWKNEGEFVYDNKGLLRQTKDADGIYSSYLWGYSGRYLLVMARNASKSQLDQGLQQVGISNPDLIRDKTTLDDNDITKLRSLGTKLPEALVNVYRLRPNVGITEYVQPNTLRSFYGYDGYGRMIATYDNSSKVTESREYNLVSIIPLAASLSCPNNTPINSSVTATMSASGGSGLYQYSWLVKNSQNQIIQQSQGTSGTFTLSPMSSGMNVNSTYTVECIVHDLVSGENVQHSQSLTINKALIFFDNIVNNIDVNNSGGTVTANIYTESATSVVLSYEKRTAASCSVSVSGTTWQMTQSEDSRQINLQAGNNLVVITISNIIAEGTLSLTVQTTESDRYVGSPDSINLEF